MYGIRGRYPKILAMISCDKRLTIALLHTYTVGPIDNRRVVKEEEEEEEEEE